MIRWRYIEPHRSRWNPLIEFVARRLGLHWFWYTDEFSPDRYRLWIGR